MKTKNSYKFAGPIITFILIASYFYQISLGPAMDELMLVFGISKYAIQEGSPVAAAITYMFLHANFSHIFFNTIGAWQIAEEMQEKLDISTQKVLLIFLSGGLIAGAATFIPVLISQKQTVVIGASGAIFAMASYFFAAYEGHEAYWKKHFWILTGFNIVLAFLMPKTAWFTHEAGIIAGYILYLILPSKSVNNEYATEDAVFSSSSEIKNILKGK